MRARRSKLQSVGCSKPQCNRHGKQRGCSGAKGTGESRAAAEHIGTNEGRLRALLNAGLHTPFRAGRAMGEKKKGVRA